MKAGNSTWEIPEIKTGIESSELNGGCDAGDKMNRFGAQWVRFARKSSGKVLVILPYLVLRYSLDTALMT